MGLEDAEDLEEAGALLLPEEDLEEAGALLLEEDLEEAGALLLEEGLEEAGASLLPEEDLELSPDWEAPPFSLAAFCRSLSL